MARDKRGRRRMPKRIDVSGIENPPSKPAEPESKPMPIIEITGKGAKQASQSEQAKKGPTSLKTVRAFVITCPNTHWDPEEKRIKQDGQNLLMNSIESIPPSVNIWNGYCIPEIRSHRTTLLAGHLCTKSPVSQLFGRSKKPTMSKSLWWGNAPTKTSIFPISSLYSRLGSFISDADSEMTLQDVFNDPLANPFIQAIANALFNGMAHQALVLAEKYERERDVDFLHGTAFHGHFAIPSQERVNFPAQLPDASILQYTWQINLDSDEAILEEVRWLTK